MSVWSRVYTRSKRRRRYGTIATIPLWRLYKYSGLQYDQHRFSE